MKPVRPVCPRCKLELHRRMAGGVSQLVCPTCYGFAVDFDDLGAVIEATHVGQIWDTSLQAESGDLNCSHCYSRMRRLAKDSGRKQRELELDLCRDCRVIWLDSGEWQDVASRDVPVETWKTVVALVGLPVEEEADVLRYRPWITWTVIAMCVLISTVGFLDAAFFKQFSHLSGLPFPRNLITTFSAFFLHASWMHLLFNMYFLWVFGDNVEDLLGKWGYAGLLVAGLFAGQTLADIGDARLRMLPGVGASAGISAVIAFYLALFPRRRFVFVFFFRRFSLPAIYFGALYFVKEIVEAVFHVGAVSHLAHLGGAAVGVTYALISSRVVKPGRA